MPLPTACVIGAGSSGIAAVKALHQREVPFDCFERSDRVGGNWAIDNPNEMSSAYTTLHINTSRERMEYSDFPMPKSIPDFPHHTHIARYFNDYVDHFGLRDSITFETTVERCARRDDGVWEVELQSGETHLYDALAVANGHHWDPRWPEPPFPGEFEGEVLHAHYYRDPAIFEGKRVVLVGMGNSAMDIAVDSSYRADRTFLSARRGAHVIPKYVSGMPVDQMSTDPRIPWPVRQRLFERMMKKTVGDMEDYGLPRPDHRLGEAHPTISGRILDRLAHGAIEPRPNIERLEGERVRFEDGSVEEIDLIVYCTGYRISFPFFDPDFVSAPDNDIRLYKRLFHPEIDNVFFIALVQPLGATMPIAEAQSVLVTDYLRGSYHLPDAAAMRAEIARDRAELEKRYVASKRHTIQVDFDDYLRDLERERRRGEERARAAGYTLPVPARARASEPAAATAS